MASSKRKYTEQFYELVSGRRRGIAASVARYLLWLLSAPYSLAVGARNRWYELRPQAVHRVEIPVISVGNLTMGGVGKTPMVKWIAQKLRHQGVRVALLSRGYGAEPGAKSDEAMELEHALPDVPHLQNPDRVASARVAIREFQSQVLLLDDGFQHRRLGRDLDIVLIDASEPFGFGHVFPRGSLREPLSSLRRADVICLTRSDHSTEIERQEIRSRVKRIAPKAQWCETSHEPQSLLNATGEAQPVERLRGKRVAAFCGIGNPEAFHRTLSDVGAEIAYWCVFPDHHAYSVTDLVELGRTIAAEEVDLIACTHKDLVKIQADSLAGLPLWAVVIEIDFLQGLDPLCNAIAPLALRATD